MYIQRFWKTALLIFAITFQIADAAYAGTGHDCCDETAPCCVMMTSPKNCSPCLAQAISGIELTSVEMHDTAPFQYHYFIDYLSLKLHVIWRPPIE